MLSTVALFISLFSVPAVIQPRDTTAVEDPLQAYGYIALAVVVLAIIVVVLIRKQYRKFNE
ncbi:hypothetical protein [Parapedobacter sp. 10938]|uniref:hypothetical protein n=1 Tax=Parapedobacter flavus TaxID=3110225 RepID=UPI002DBDB0CA|nr:hypothetical protein [Parapedobacter sp. 10938]MEC3878707.1 hypothetical protein [Parapedobacter sp. 10938]